MKILLLGSGGREHALAWKMTQSNSVEHIYVVPGNDGMSDTKKVQTVSGDPNDKEYILTLINNLKINLVIVGPEKPLALGIVDALESENIPVLGPTSFAAQLESSKVFSKDFMIENNIPTARHESYKSFTEAKDSLKNWDMSKGIAIKADELASGKGVVVTDDQEIAEKTLYDFMENPDCSVKTKSIVIEEKLNGRELSAFALCDGHTFIPFGYACDYKRVYDDDQGPNTGGMGAHNPKDWPSEKCKKFINDSIFTPVLEGMKKLNHPFKGILFAGLMIDDDESVKVIEFNVRLGDPEAQIILPLVEGDIVPVFEAAALGKLTQLEEENKGITLKEKYAHHVVMTSKGYPSIDNTPMSLGNTIDMSKLENINSDNFQVFYSGVKRNQESNLVNSGGRVLGVTTLGKTLEDAKKQTYDIVTKIKFEGAHFRNDIGK